MSQGLRHTLLANSKNCSFDLLQEKSQLVKKINPSSSICRNIIAADRPLFFDSRQPASTHAKQTHAPWPKAKTYTVLNVSGFRSKYVYLCDQFLRHHRVNRIARATSYTRLHQCSTVPRMRTAWSTLSLGAIGADMTKSTVLRERIRPAIR